MSYTTILHTCTCKTAIAWMQANPSHLDLLSWTPGKLIRILPATTMAAEYSPSLFGSLYHPVLEASEASQELRVLPPVPMPFLRLQVAIRRPHLVQIITAHEYLAEHPEKDQYDAADFIGRNQALVSNQMGPLRELIAAIIPVYKLKPGNELERMILDGRSQIEIASILRCHQGTVSSKIRKTCRKEYRELSGFGVYRPLLTQTRADKAFVGKSDKPYERLLEGVAWDAIITVLRVRADRKLRAKCVGLMQRVRNSRKPPSANDSVLVDEILRIYPDMAPVLRP